MRCWGCWGVLTSFRNSCIGIVWGVDSLSLGEAVVTVAEGGESGADRGSGGHILVVTLVDALA